MCCVRNMTQLVRLMTGAASTSQSGSIRIFSSADKGAPGDVRSKLKKLLTNVKPTTVESPAIFDGTIPLNRLTIAYSRPSAPGGQNVNASSSRAMIRFVVADADWIPAHVRDDFLKMQQLNNNGEMIVRSEERRTAHENLNICLERLREMIFESQLRLAKADEPPSLEEIERKAMLEQRANNIRLRDKERRSMKKARRNSSDD